MSEGAKLVIQWIFVLNSVKQKFFPVCIVKSLNVNKANEPAGISAKNDS